jgi:hypothetical protein
MKHAAALLVAALLTPACLFAHSGEVAHYSDPDYGFSFDIPSLGSASGAHNVQRIAVTGPARNGFAPNCGVQIQFTKMTFADYLNLSHRQFKASKITIIAEHKTRVSGLPAVTVEYKGNLRGRDLHFLSLAVRANDRIWLLTCTALEDSFSSFKNDFSGALKSGCDQRSLVGTFLVV